MRSKELHPFLFVSDGTKRNTYQQLQVRMNVTSHMIGIFDIESVGQQITLSLVQIFHPTIFWTAKSEECIYVCVCVK